MRYMLMLYADEKAGADIPAEDMKAAMQDMAAYESALAKAGAFVATSALQPTWESKTIRMEGGEVMRQTTPSGHVYFANEGGELKVHDGPYAETREQFGGYFIIDAPDMDAAIDWARKCPAVQWGSIEIRPYHPGYGA
ncbi:YciI family protein [Devosia sp. ZB163]|uniref:YciI family protein n=1 Tax=Devosia sp. ZB163 TaxID=3025938 RepID=UPI00235DD151|nr:YciI family protein [Devosia sp. ZB163]MDC9825557.1 YciI family protein [Devosia sp. ZB163]